MRKRAPMSTVFINKKRVPVRVGALHSLNRYHYEALFDKRLNYGRRI